MAASDATPHPWCIRHHGSSTDNFQRRWRSLNQHSHPVNPQCRSLQRTCWCSWGFWWCLCQRQRSQDTLQAGRQWQRCGVSVHQTHQTQGWCWADTQCSRRNMPRQYCGKGPVSAQLARTAPHFQGWKAAIPGCQVDTHIDCTLCCCMPTPQPHCIWPSGFRSTPLDTADHKCLQWGRRTRQEVAKES